MMKLSLLFASLFLVSNIASAEICKTRGAHILGIVTDTKTVKIDQGVHDCYLTIKLIEVNPEGTCPLHPEAIVEAFVAPQKCVNLYQPNDRVSGLLIQDQNGVQVLESSFNP